MRNRMPPYIPLMALVTAAYLTVEIPFSVHLVEVMGGDPSQEDIDSIESFGRVLTGIAVSIWIVGVLVLPRMHKRGYGFFLSVAAAVAVSHAATGATYLALDVIATETGRSATGAERKEAFIGNLARRHISANGRLGDLSDTGASDWQVFVSTVPVFSGSAALAAATGLEPGELARNEAVRLIGNPQDYREEVFGDGFRAVRSSYADYEKGSEVYLSAQAGLADDAQQAWLRFRDEVERRYPNGVRRNSYTETFIIRKVLFDMKIPVDRNRWTITDRAGFVRPYMKVAAEKIDTKYREGVERALGEGQHLKPGLGIDGFAAHPAVQRRIRKALDLPATGAAISPGMGESSFREQVYLPKIAALEREMERAAAAPASEFENGEDFASLGIDAVRATRLPAMAILLSIAGAALHIFKFAGYLAQMAGYGTGMSALAHGSMRHVIGAAAAAACFAFMAFSGNGITGTSAYGSVKDQGAYAALLHGAIAIQPEFSALGRVIGEVGGWQAFASGLPAASPQSPARTSLPVPASNNRSSVVLPEGRFAPRPTWRPVD